MNTHKRADWNWQTVCMTGWQFNNAGNWVRPKDGFQDNIYESDFRGHSLDAPQQIPAGGHESYGFSRIGHIPLYVSRDAK